MSWWDTGKDDDVIGDQPADFFRHALEQIIGSRAASGREKPALADLLKVFGIALNQWAGAEASRNGGALTGIIATLGSGGTVASGDLDDALDSKDLFDPLTKALTDTDAVYRDRWKRAPRTSELLQALEFVLGFGSEDFLRDGGPDLNPTLRAT
jgi:hypothetical protein